MVAAAAKSAGGRGKNAVQFKDKEKPTDIRESNIEAAKGTLLENYRPYLFSFHHNS